VRPPQRDAVGGAFLFLLRSKRLGALLSCAARSGILFWLVFGVLNYNRCFGNFYIQVGHGLSFGQLVLQGTELSRTASTTRPQSGGSTGADGRFALKLSRLIVRRYCVLSDVNVRERLHQPKDIQQPQHDGYHYDRIHNRLDGTRHGDEAIDQPQKDPYHDQGYDDLK
jgi:hypothetical protein